MVEHKRAYSSDLRAEQAGSTKRRIVAAASELFAEKGYVETTIDAIAERAGVSRKTVFTSVGGKVALLKLGFDWAVGGDDADIPKMERPEILRLRGLTDPYEVIDGWAASVASDLYRVAPINSAMEVAASVDPEGAALLADIRSQRLRGMRMLATQLDQLGGLREDLSVKQAADLLALHLEPTAFTHLIRRRGWSQQRFAEWLARSLRASVLR